MTAIAPGAMPYAYNSTRKTWHASIVMTGLVIQTCLAVADICTKSQWEMLETARDVLHLQQHVLTNDTCQA